jgi:desulfoferrodoxin-like iron-binding protein
MVNVRKAGGMYRCNVCRNVVLVSEAGGGELVCNARRCSSSGSGRASPDRYTTVVTVFPVMDEVRSLIHG